MRLTPLVCEGSVLRAIATMNGRQRCNVIVRHLADTDDVPPLAVDDLNLAAARERAALLEQLDAALRPDAEEVLRQLAELVAAERVQDTRRRGEPPEDDTPRPPAFSDDALALEFTARHSDDHRFTAQWGHWSRWDGTRWAQDSTLSVFDRIRTVNREKAAGCGDPKVASIVASAKTVAAVERLARTDRAHAATAEQWDVDTMALNTPGGTVNLRTGELRPHRREDYCTKSTAVAPGGEAPQWEALLAWATGGDVQLQAFLKRAFGYCLTGSIEEHALFFLYGTGGNGKGTILNTVTRILGDYARVAPIETFTASHSDRHPTELAMLRGARLVTSQETEEGRRWAESRVKGLTGGDPIPARFMRGDFFTFEPQFKLVIAGNHRPGLRSVDEAIRRRFHLVPFEQTITADQRDPQLPEKLRTEWPGILAWMVEGCLEWLEGGLRPPASVQDATAEYLEAEDSFGTWLDECCVRRPTHWASVADLFASWAQWAERAGEHAGSAKKFSMQMQSRGFVPAKSGHAKTRGFAGISRKLEASRGYLAS